MKKTISLVLVLAFGLASMSPAAEDTWTTKADMPTARSYLSASVVDGKIYVIGGLSDQARALPIVEMYDPVTDTWVRKADMPTARLNLSTSVVGRRIYAIGGLPGTVGAAYSKVEEYDPATDTWRQKADMPTARNGFGAGVVDGRIYTIGGHTIEPAGAKAGLSTVEVYDPVTDTWTRKADMPTARTGLSISVVGGKIYAMGGVFTSPWSGLPTVEVYDPATDTWTRKADMITGRSSLSTIAVDKKIYAIGGASTNPWPGLPTVEIYDPATDTWAQKADMPTGRLALATSAVDGKIYSIGGCMFLRPFLPVFSTVEEYDLFPLVVDFNGDGIVDATDICLMLDHWLTDEPFYDIAPIPFGDGIVDVLDLIVLAEHLFERFPPVEPQEINVNEEDAGGQVELEQGQILVVTLKSNPTTGYRWEVIETQESILEQMGEAEFKPSQTGEPPLVGAGGLEIFRFKAISAGRMTLQLVYHKAWEEGVEPVKTFSLEVVVN